MRLINAKLISVTASLLLGLSFVGNASAVPVSTDLADLDGIAPSGNPNFTFDAINDSDYSNTIQSWFSNILYIQSLGNGLGYSLFASQEGDFTYWASPNQSHQGTNGVFNLYAEFDAAGNLEFGEMAIAGRVSGVGINDPDTILMRATLVKDMFKSEGNLMGFGISVTDCAVQIESECQIGPLATEESVYFFTEGNLPNISSLGNNDYQTTLATITTVPIPASIWLMLSALSLASVMARHKKQRV
jgi:hypothetical protein